MTCLIFSYSVYLLPFHDNNYTVDSHYPLDLGRPTTAHRLRELAAYDVLDGPRHDKRVVRRVQEHTTGPESPIILPACSTLVPKSLNVVSFAQYPLLLSCSLYGRRRILWLSHLTGLFYMYALRSAFFRPCYPTVSMRARSSYLDFTPQPRVTPRADFCHFIRAHSLTL